MASKKKFKTESKQILDLMVHSIYANKDVFLRELISNGSDALDKRHFYSLQDESYKYSKLFIELSFNKEERTITIKDNGCGMDATDLDNNLGTIAKSGTKEFIEQLQNNNDETISSQIGQFGVGFYSAFIVSDKVTVITTKPNNPTLKWVSDGAESYSVEEIDSTEIGTTIILHMREGEEFDAFLEQYQLETLVKKYSDYIKYPIEMDVEVEKPVETEPEEVDDKETKEPEMETVIERKVLNSQIALWKKAKKDITSEEYNNFYTSKYYDYQEPLHTIHVNVEGTTTFDLLTFIPQKKPYDFHNPTFKKGLDLYSKGVLIEHNVDYLIPDRFSFVKGLVDSSDVNLNVSREMLQKDQVVNKISVAIENQIKKSLQKLLKKDREKYEQFYQEFGPQLMVGIYQEFGQKKELYQDLIMFKTNKGHKYVTLKEYLTNNPTTEKIYFIAGKDIEQIEKLPAMEKIKNQEIEVLYFLDDIDEFAIQMLREYEKKPFQSIVNEDFATAEQKEKVEELQKENTELLSKIKEVLKDKITDVKLTNTLEESAVYLTTSGGMSLEMEKVLAQMPGNEMAKAQKILEINPNHPVFNKIQSLNLDSDEQITLYANLLYNQACISEGYPIDDPVEFAKQINELLIK